LGNKIDKSKYIFHYYWNKCSISTGIIFRGIVLSNTEILKKISDKSIKIGIIGLGYVGLPLAVTFARNGVLENKGRIGIDKCSIKKYL
jgi:hypothetical protein